MMALVQPAASTVNSSTNRAVVLGNGSQTAFTFSFIGVASAYISVLLTDSAGTQTLLSQGSGTTQFQLTLNPVVQGAIWGVGGTVTYNPSGTPIPAGSTLTIFRTLPLTQAVNLQNLGSIATLGKGAETGLDTGVMQGQQINETIGRAIVANIANSAAPLPLPAAAAAANKGLCFDGTGNNVIACSLAPSGAISSAMAPVVSAATLALGRTAFGLGNISVENIGKGLQDDGSGAVRVTGNLIESIATNINIGASDHLELYRATGPLTMTLARANTLWNGFTFAVYSETGAVTLAIDASDNFINQSSGASLTVPANATAIISTDAANSGLWMVQWGQQLQSARTPSGYLTPCKNTSPVSGCTAGNLVPTSDVTAATILYYEPSGGNQVPIYNGAQFGNFNFTEAQMTLTLSAANLANNIYDVCIFNNGGTPQIATSVAWTTSTAGSGSRGTGAGTAEITRVGGLWVNNVQITAKNGAQTYTVPANQCTIVASILIDGTNGQVTFNRSYGQSRRWAAWNFYNRLPLYLKAGDSTATWTYNSNTFRPSNGNTANSLTIFTGLQEETAAVSFSQYVNTAGGAGNITHRVAIGVNSTTASSGMVGALISSSQVPVAGELIARYDYLPSIGANTLTSLEAVTNTAVDTFSGTETNMVLTAQWRG